jgi:hypothetical protein
MEQQALDSPRVVRGKGEGCRLGVSEPCWPVLTPSMICPLVLDGVKAVHPHSAARALSPACHSAHTSQMSCQRAVLCDRYKRIRRHGKKWQLPSVIAGHELTGASGVAHTCPVPLLILEVSLISPICSCVSRGPAKSAQMPLWAPPIRWTPGWLHSATQGQPCLSGLGLGNFKPQTQQLHTIPHHMVFSSS